MPGLSWMPGEDRDPFGHDDETPEDERSRLRRGRQSLVVAVVGPTATGKSDLAIALARRLGGEVVNADASQLYRGMDIGTAKVPLDAARGHRRTTSSTCST